MDIPSEEDISQAIEDANSILIAKYAVQLEFARQQQSAQLPELIEAHGNAKRDLDICRASVKHFADTINMLQSVLKQLPRNNA